MPQAPHDPHPIGVAMEWVSRILVVSAEMVVPGLIGQWLDSRWGYSFLGLLGFGVGMTLGVFHLLVMTRPKPPASKQQPPSTSNENERP